MALFNLFLHVSLDMKRMRVILYQHTRARRSMRETTHFISFCDPRL